MSTEQLFSNLAARTDVIRWDFLIKIASIQGGFCAPSVIIFTGSIFKCLTKGCEPPGVSQHVNERKNEWRTNEQRKWVLCVTDNLGCKRICRQEGSFITCYSGRLIFNKTSLSGWYIGLIVRSLSPSVNLTLAFSHHILSAVSCSTNKRLLSLVKDDPFDLCRLHFITPPLFFLVLDGINQCACVSLSSAVSFARDAEVNVIPFYLSSSCVWLSERRCGINVRQMSMVPSVTRCMFSCCE